MDDKDLKVQFEKLFKDLADRRVLTPADVAKYNIFFVDNQEPKHYSIKVQPGNFTIVGAPATLTHLSENDAPSAEHVLPRDQVVGAMLISKTDDRFLGVPLFKSYELLKEEKRTVSVRGRVNRAADFLSRVFRK